MKKNFDNLYEKLGGTYREENGHFIPDIALNYFLLIWNMHITVIPIMPPTMRPTKNHSITYHPSLRQ